ncbi:hypothetical protein BH11MYX1_BH11MYX1_47760 [soil metagenome]
MAMQRALIVGLLAGSAGVAGADTFGGFSSIDVPYLVNQDRICAPLEVASSAASGTPKCEKAAADDIAKLTIKAGVTQSGTKATYAATAAARTLTVTKQGSTAVVWTAPDPIGKVVDVFASAYEDRVAVTYTTRQLGKEVTNVVAFVIVKTTGRDPNAIQKPAPTPISQPATATAPPEDPAVTKAVVAARKAAKGKALAAWRAVLAADPAHAEAQYEIARIQAGAKQTAEAVSTLEQLAKSSRGDAIEWLVEARRDPVFASVRADAKFRAAVGLDRAPGTAVGPAAAYGPAGQAYEKLMGFGGQWEQAGTSCDAPEIRLALKRDRSVKLNVKLSCNGRVDDIPFRGTWRIDDADHVTLVLPTKGQAATVKDEAGCVWKKHGEEDALHCIVGKDLEFEALPTRR